MNTKTVALFLSLASLSACVSTNGPYSGDIQFTWSFTGLTCSQAQVVSVAITIPGEVLQNNGVYPCLTNNYPGIVLHDFLPGDYSFTIQGLDARGNPLYAASGTFHINGSIQVPVDLQPTASYAYLNWSFPANATCAQARVDAVDVTIDQGAPTRYACADGQTQQGVLSVPLSIGTHTITLAASSAEVNHSYPYYTLVNAPLTTSATPVAAAYQLPWVVGGVAVQWDFISGSCTTVPTIYVNFLDPFGNLLYGPSGDPQTCVGGLFPSAIRYDYLPSGSYFLTLQGSYAGTVYTNTPYPQVIISAGVFSDPQRPVLSYLHP